MEKKTKYRILGILLIIAVVIILLPFLSRRNEFTTDSIALKAPPFPNQTINVVSDNEITSETSAIQPEIQQEASTSNDRVHLETDDVISTTHPSVINQIQVPEIRAPKQVKENVPEVKLVQNEIIIKRDSLTQSNPIKNTNNHLNNPAITVNLKNIFWVVQMGSFKNKENALRLVNQLRAGGYHAFIQKISNELGERTRVFVGPANKKADAHQLAMRLENDLHIRGVIISYKPLSL